MLIEGTVVGDLARQRWGSTPNGRVCLMAPPFRLLLYAVRRRMTSPIPIFARKNAEKCPFRPVFGG